MSKRIALLSAAVFSALAFTATINAPVSAQEKTVMVGGGQQCNTFGHESSPEDCDGRRVIRR